MGTLSKNKIKYIRSLEVKKVRKEERVFLAEGPKLVGDLLGHFHCRFLAATSSWFRKHTDVSADELIEISSEELSRASLLKTPQEVLAVFEQPVYELSDRFVRRSLCLALDDIQDPGNLGTIIRIADWFGIEHVICSANTVDVYNPKTIQATMGNRTSKGTLHFTPRVYPFIRRRSRIRNFSGWKEHIPTAFIRSWTDCDGKRRERNRKGNRRID